MIFSLDDMPPEDLEKLKAACLAAARQPTIVVEPKINSFGAYQLIEALRDRIQTSNDPALADQAFSLLEELEANFRATELREEQLDLTDEQAVQRTKDSRRLAYLAAVEIYEKLSLTRPGVRSDEKAIFFTPAYLKWALTQICVYAGYWEEDKLHRWLGWCQAISNCLGLTTINEERDRIRTLKAELKEKS